jgi:hypothetical protein
MLIFILASCGGSKNTTALEASKTMMGAIVEGDVKGVAQVNMSDAWNYPPEHMINLANDRNLVGKDIDKFVFKELSDQFIKVSWKDQEGNESAWYLKFNQTDKGYFFVKIDNFEGELLDED